jgi:hypothetical protein
MRVESPWSKEDVEPEPVAKPLNLLPVENQQLIVGMPSQGPTITVRPQPPFAEKKFRWLSTTALVLGIILSITTATSQMEESRAEDAAAGYCVGFWVLAMIFEGAHYSRMAVHNENYGLDSSSAKLNIALAIILLLLGVGVFFALF